MYYSLFINLNNHCKVMDDSKIFMFPDGGTRQTSNDVNSLLPLLMCNGGFGSGKSSLTMPSTGRL